MAWTELHQTVFNHRKTMSVAEALDMPEVHVVGHLGALWCWCLDNAPDGDLPESDRVVAKAAYWTGDPSQFVDALRVAGFLDQNENGTWFIHDWEEYGGKLIKIRRENAEKQSRYRDRQKTHPATSPTPNRDVTVTLPSRNQREKSREENSINSVSHETGVAAKKIDLGLIPEEPTEPDLPPDEDPEPAPTQPYDLLVTLCEEIGGDIDRLSPRDKDIQLRAGKTLVSEGMTPEKLRAEINWLSGQSWVAKDGGIIDLKLCTGQLPKWRLAGEPTKARASPSNGRQPIIQHAPTKRLTWKEQAEEQAARDQGVRT